MRPPPDKYILIAEDNPADQELLRIAFTDMGLQESIVIVNNGEEVLYYLRTFQTIPFIIISDINMPKKNGLELLKEIYLDINLRIKSIPFVFFTSSATKNEINGAYLLTAQGYFQKPMNFSSFADILKKIIDYWSTSQLPRI